ncbi:MAG: hypothetical protein HYX72_11970 [Acidobacteria bacterium]|nr:hypothetical protein [Acidobacteriota bacterium]
MFKRRIRGGVLIAALLLCREPLAYPQQKSAANTPIAISEFSRMVQEFSEEGGYFQADNFTSNESSYLHVVDKLREFGVSGGAYIGVGPEQNFTYIAKIRPRIAFMVDIRRQAIIEHLLYKAVFHLSHDRAEFLSLLFSKPLSKDRAEAEGSLEDLLRYIFTSPVSASAYADNLTLIQQTIEETFHVPLSSSDVESLRRIYYVFWRLNLRIAYGYGFPTMADLILETDLHGRAGNYLAVEQDFQFVREMHEQNRIIPVVGDISGRKAVTAIADYLRKNGHSVSAFYTSNVEEYLYDDNQFGGFVENVKKLPVTERSVIIRSVKGYLGQHPAWVPGTRMITLLEKIPVFLDDYKAGLYPNYWALVTTHYISAGDRQVDPSSGSKAAQPQP